MIHRDIKPANILLAQGEPLVAELEVVTETTDMHHFPFALEGGTHVLYQDFSRAASTPVGLAVASLADGRTLRLDFTDAQIDVVVGVADDVLLYRAMGGP